MLGLSGISLGMQVPQGVNLQAISIWVYPTHFLLGANKEMTRVNSKIKIDRKTQDILQMDAQQPVPQGFEKKILCSALLGILPVLNKRFLLLVQLCKETVRFEDCPIYEIQQLMTIPFETEQSMENSKKNSTAEQNEKNLEKSSKIIDHLTYLKSYLLVEGYYFSFKYNLSLSRTSHAKGFPAKKKFFWNYNIAQNIAKLSDKRWFVGLIQGSIRCFKVILEGGAVLDYNLITRRSWAKGGTRYNSRGIDLKGNVANFCETQQLIFIEGYCYSHLQIRGSVPCFWKQSGLYADVFLQKNKDQNQHCFSRHFQRLIRNYGKVLSVNLLCKDKQGQIDLTLYYERLVQQLNIKDLKYQYFDVHCASKGQRFERCNYLVDKIEGSNHYFGYYRQDLATKTVLQLQQGVVRVNCLDNLDRTNLIQSKIAYQVLTHILSSLKFDIKTLVGTNSILTAADNASNTSILIIHLKNAWADNGDMISKHYTGTGSTHTNVTRTGKRDIKGMIDHSFKSCKRLYQQFVDDNQKQEVIDIFLGEHTQTVNLSEIEARLKDITETEDEILTVPYEFE